MKMKRDEYHVGRHALGQLHHHHRIAALRNHAYVLLMFDAEFFGGIRVHFHKWRGAELVAIRDFAGARARVEMFNETAAVEPEWKLLVGLFIVVLETHGNQVGLAVWCRKFAIAV